MSIYKSFEIAFDSILWQQLISLSDVMIIIGSREWSKDSSGLIHENL